MKNTVTCLAAIFALVFGGCKDDDDQNEQPATEDLVEGDATTFVDAATGDTAPGGETRKGDDWEGAPETREDPAEVTTWEDSVEESDTPEGEDVAGSPGAPGETCAEALDLASVSGEMAPADGVYTHRAAGSFGSANDYNPYQNAGLPPQCSQVFDAMGNDLVFTVTLQPGQTLHARLGLEPVSAIQAIYLVEGCPVTGWPDLDESGLCGDNEYTSLGFCPLNACYPLEWSFTWPNHIGGEATAKRTFFLVVDEVAGTTATGYELEWGIDG